MALEDIVSTLAGCGSAGGRPSSRRRPPAQKQYSPGVTDTEIKIGTTTPYSGPASAYSAGAVSATAYFAMINEQGGVNGRKINFISLDDAYSPPKTVEQIRRLIESDEVLFLVNPVGTATNMAVVKYINQQKVPHLFVGSGATVFNDPEHYPWTMSWTPHYASEGEIYARYILSTKPDAKIGILSQNDDLGRDYLLGFKRGLGEQGVGDDRVVADLQHQRSDRRFPGGFPEGFGRQRIFHRHGPEILRASHSQGLRHRLASAGIRSQRRFVDRGRDQAGGVRSCKGHHLRGLSEGSGRPAVEETIPPCKTWNVWMDKYNPRIDKSDYYAPYGYNIGYRGGPAPQAVRRQSYAREYHEAGFPSGHGAAAAAAGDPPEDQPYRPAPDQADAAGAFRWPRATCCSATCSRATKVAPERRGAAFRSAGRMIVCRHHLCGMHWRCNGRS